MTAVGSMNPSMTSAFAGSCGVIRTADAFHFVLLAPLATTHGMMSYSKLTGASSTFLAASVACTRKL
jgi:hypothetical protein